MGHVIQDVHVFLSSAEKKLRFLMKTFQDFLYIMDFIWGANSSRSKWEFHCSIKGL